MCVRHCPRTTHEWLMGPRNHLDAALGWGSLDSWLAVSSGCKVYLKHIKEGCLCWEGCADPPGAEPSDETDAAVTGHFRSKTYCTHSGLHAWFDRRKAECIVLLTRLMQQSFKNKPFKLMCVAWSHRSTAKECTLFCVCRKKKKRQEKRLGIYSHREWAFNQER